MTYRLVSLLLPLVIGALTATLFLRAPFFQNLEERALDGLIVSRYLLHGALPIDPRIVIVGVDDTVYSRIRKPASMWDKEWAELSSRLLQAGARVTALDYTPNMEMEDLPEALQAQIMADRVPLLQALLVGNLLLGDLPDDQERRGAHAHRSYMEVAQQAQALVMLTVVADADNVHRTIPLYAPLQDGEGRLPSLAARAAELVTGDPLKVEGATAHLGPRAVPVEFEGDNHQQPYLRINFPAPHDAFRRLQMSDVLAGRRIPDLKDCVCLIGPWNASSQDHRAGPFNLLPKHDNYGIEIHAAALNTLLTGRGISRLPGGANLALCVVGCYALFALASGWRFKRSVIYGLLVLVGYVLLAEEALARAGLWLPLCAPLGAWLLSYLGGFMARYYTVERNRRATRDMFRRMVAPEVVEHVLDNPEALRPGGTARRVTVLYTDINDFTPMCESSQPQEVIEMLNRYFEEMVTIIRSNKGMLKQFVGDEIMVIYGAPTSYGNDAARAVNTALEMLERLREMEEQDPTGRGFYDIKVGIHTGDVVVGHVGSMEHMEYAAVGDDVNLGARIMATTKKLTNVKVLVSDVTRREAAPLLPHVEWISHGEQSFKGKTARMEVFEIRRRPAAPKENA